MASLNTSASQLPNPFTPLAFLPPSSAEQYEASIYISVATLSAFVWDWLTSMPQEIKMCPKKRISPAIFAYIFSRIGALGCCATAVVFQAASVAHCKIPAYVGAGCYVVAVSSTCVLFFLRVKAVYSDSKIITVFFGFMLLAIFGSSLVIPISVKVEHLGSTQRCIPKGHVFTSYASTPCILNAIFDTLVFIAISLRIVSYSIVGDMQSARIWSALRGDGLPSLSRSLLQGGQLYYFVTIGSNIAIVGLVYAPVPPPFQGMFIVPNIALESAMACRVFRGIRLGLIKDTSGSCTKATSLRFATIVASTKEQPRHFNSSLHRAHTNETMQTTESGEP